MFHQSQHLQNRCFLLEEYGKEDDWKRFLVPFKKQQGNGDTILVTTRFLEVATMARRGDKLLELEGLECGEYWNLFLASVCDKIYHDMDLTKIGEEIVKKLKGSPLAAKTVGRLLRKKINCRSLDKSS